MENMILTYKCLQCGSIHNCTDELCHDLPDSCPDCGAGREEMAPIEED